MKQFLLKTSLFAFLVVGSIVGGLVGVSAFVKRNHFENHQAKGNLLVIKPNQHYNLCFLGISHARMFSSYGHHPKVERMLNRNILNLGRGEGSCGINEQLFYLHYAYKQGVRIDTVVYFVSPILMYAGYLNRASDTFNHEPFDFAFLLDYWSFPAEGKKQRIYSYLRSKFGPHWYRVVPDNTPDVTDSLDVLDWDAVQDGFELAYKDGQKDSIFNYNAQLIRQTVDTARSHGTEVLFVVTPALFGKWPGYEKADTFFRQLETELGTPYYDFAEVLPNPGLYEDNHHLNTKGIVLFTDSFLRPILALEASASR